MNVCRAIVLTAVGIWFAAGSIRVTCQSAKQPIKVSPATMAKIGTIDERYQSYNIEAVEVTGGRFWKPYGSSSAQSPANGSSIPNAPGGMDPSLYEYRSPIDLSNARLRKMAEALGPASLRVSGTWINSTYFQDSEGPALAAPPKGFNSVLTRQQWKGVVDFAHAVNASLVTSFAVSAGTRDADGVWAPDEARKLLNYTKSLGGSIAAAEFMNEPTFPEMGGAPKGYDAAAYSRDFAVFRQFMRMEFPNVQIVGPGGVGEGSVLTPASMHTVSSGEILRETGPAFQAFSYHLYAGVSHRCAQMSSDATTTPEAALSDDWLGRAGKIESYYEVIRDDGLRGRPIWVTETAQTACGGDRWASTFLDSFRYLNQLGTLARMGVQVQMYNTLAASDYGLLDEKSYEPRPNYWAALLWRRLMGNTVLDSGTPSAPGLHVFAHCLREKPGGVALLAINADKRDVQSLEIPIKAEGYTLGSAQLDSKTVTLNGTTLKLGTGDALPAFKPKVIAPGEITLQPASITLFAFPKANNASCR